RGSISSSTALPSHSDHSSPIVSSPTRTTTPPISLSCASTYARLSCQSACVFGSFNARLHRSPLASSTYDMAALCTASCAMSYRLARSDTIGLNAGCVVTSFTRSPLIHTCRPSRSESRYCAPVRSIARPLWICRPWQQPVPHQLEQLISDQPQQPDHHD